MKNKIIVLLKNKYFLIGFTTLIVGGGVFSFLQTDTEKDVPILNKNITKLKEKKEKKKIENKAEEMKSVSLPKKVQPQPVKEVPVEKKKVVDNSPPEVPSLKYPTQNFSATYESLKEIPSMKLQWEYNNSDYYLVDLLINENKIEPIKTYFNYLELKDLDFMSYKWRVIGVKNGKKSNSSEIRFFSFDKKIKFEIFEPTKNINLKYYIAEPIIKFRWKGEDHYVLRIIREGNLQEVILGNDGEYSYYTLGKSFKWEIILAKNKAKPLAEGQVEIVNSIKPPESSQVSIYKPDQNIEFIWCEQDQYINNARIEFAINSDFKEITYETETNLSSFFIPYKKLDPYLEFRTLFWRVLTYDEKSEQYNVYGSHHEFTPVKSNESESPKIKEYIKLTEKDSVEGGYFINWPFDHKLNKYKIQIFSSDNIKKPLVNTFVNSNEFQWKMKIFNTYYYRIKGVDHWGRETKYSKVGKIVAPIAPLHSHKEELKKIAEQKKIEKEVKSSINETNTGPKVLPKANVVIHKLEFNEKIDEKLSPVQDNNEVFENENTKKLEATINLDDLLKPKEQ